MSSLFPLFVRVCVWEREGEKESVSRSELLLEKWKRILFQSDSVYCRCQSNIKYVMLKKPFVININSNQIIFVLIKESLVKVRPLYRIGSTRGQFQYHFISSFWAVTQIYADLSLTLCWVKTVGCDFQLCIFVKLDVVSFVKLNGFFWAKLQAHLHFSPMGWWNRP